MAVADPTSTVAPGWYPDPQGAPALRWWDGQTWTAATSPVPGTAVAPVVVQQAKATGLQREVPFTVKVLMATLIVIFVLSLFGVIGR